MSEKDSERKPKQPIISDPLWKRAGFGRPVLFETPDDLWKAALNYFEWAENTPLWEAKAFSYQGDSWLEYLPKLRALTIDGFRLHAGIARQTWYNYKENKDFLDITSQIEDSIREQKFTGAAADLLNANIIARDLGLADKKDLSSSDGTMSPQKELSDEELLDKLESYGIRPDK